MSSDNSYKWLNDRIDRLEMEKFKLEEQIRRFDKERDDYEKRINDLINETSDLEIKVIKAEKLNYSLKRICRERANADRGLKPKKEHDGFVVLSTASYFERYQSSVDRQTKEFLAYRTVIQTPYSVFFSMQTVLDIIIGDGYNCFHCLGDYKYHYVHFGANCNADSQKSEYKDCNYLFRWNLRGVSQKKYWEIEVCHTKPYLGKLLN